MPPKKTIYYEDLLNDDFANTGFDYKPLPDNFKYSTRNPIARFFSFIFYYVFGIPILWIYAKIATGFRIVGKKKLRKSHLKGGYFIYGNHTSACDAMFVPAGLLPPKRVAIVCGQAAVSKAFPRPFEMALGALPLPETANQKKAYTEEMARRLKKGHAILIFPEAHIWPYCTMIRPFPDTSFTYPATFGSPVVAVCTTYEKRKICPKGKPRAVIHVSEPFYPDMSKPLGERTHLLREAVYNYMVETSSSLDNVEYYRYLPKKEETEQSEEKK